MNKISSSFFIARGNNKSSSLHKRVRLMPYYSFPHTKDQDHKITQNQNRFFLHLDFDCFFAQVEQRDNPKLKGLPVSVGGNGGNKGIVMTSSYEARARGVKTGMSVWEARKICPELISIPSYGGKYEAILLNVIDKLKNALPEDCIEQYSIDEIFLDATPIAGNYFQAIRFAAMVKKMIWELETLTVSIGLSYNKSYAKIATKFRKPDGLTAIREENKDIIYALPARKIWGVGRKIEERLAAMNIHTIGDLANSNYYAMHKEFGINGIVLRKMARGEDTSGIVNEEVRIEKSFNHSHTLNESIYEDDDVMNEIKRMVEYVCRKMRRKDLITDHISLDVRYDDLGFKGDKMRIDPPTNSQTDLYNAAVHIYKTLPKPGKKRKVRQFTVGVFELHKVTGYNLDLFNKNALIPYKQIDKLKEKYGESSVRLGLDKK
jgi:DNA polymerase-4